MLSASEMTLALVHSSILFATTVTLARGRTEQSPSSSLSTNTTNHYWIATSLFGCSVISAYCHVLVLGNDGSFGWLLLFTAIILWMIRARWPFVWLILWFTGFGLELLILFHIMGAERFSTSGSSSDEKLELWMSLSHLTLFVFIGVCLLRTPHVDDTGHFPRQSTPLREGDLEANYNTYSRSLPRRRKESWSNRFLRFIVHIWPKSVVLRLLFLSRILLLLMQRVVNLLLPYLVSVFLERNFQLSNERKCTEVPVLQALRTYLYVRVLEKSLDVLQKSLWNRVSQSGSLSGTSTTFSDFLGKDEEWNKRHSTSEKLSALGKFRAVIKFSTEALFGILPTIMDLVLAVWFAANRFGVLCAIKFTLSGLCLIGFLLWSSRRTALLEKTRSDAKDYIEDFRGDLIGSYQTIQILQKEAKATADHDMAMYDGQDPDNNLIDWLSKSDVTQEIIFSLGLYFLIQQAVTGVSADNVKPVDISALYALAVQLQKQLGTLGDCFRRTLRYWVKGCRVFDLIGENSTTADVPDAVDLVSCQGNVEFQNVEFAYSTKPVLRHVSFDCGPGETVVFVGKSGAGKSTILDLIFRRYLVQNGYVHIDGQDIRKLTLKSLRGQIGVVPQNPTLLNRTILGNLRFANETVTKQKIEEISRSLGFHDTFEQLGYDTNVGESGSRLSGGQRMMVAITRIMIRGCKIVLLDEATGPFDHMTEKIFQRAVDTLKVSKTVIMIAHRKSTVERADRVFWLRDGSLSGAGTHDRLIAENKDYASFWEGDSRQS